MSNLKERIEEIIYQHVFEKKYLQLDSVDDAKRQRVEQLHSLFLETLAEQEKVVLGAVPLAPPEDCSDGHGIRCPHEVLWDWKQEIIDNWASPTDGTLWPVPKEQLIEFCERVRTEGYDEGKKAYFDVDQPMTLNAARSSVVEAMKKWREGV